MNSERDKKDTPPPRPSVRMHMHAYHEKPLPASTSTSPRPPAPPAHPPRFIIAQRVLSNVLFLLSAGGWVVLPAVPADVINAGNLQQYTDGGRNDKKPEKYASAPASRYPRTPKPSSKTKAVNLKEVKAKAVKAPPRANRAKVAAVAAKRKIKPTPRAAAAIAAAKPAAAKPAAAKPAAAVGRGGGKGSGAGLASLVKRVVPENVRRGRSRSRSSSSSISSSSNSSSRKKKEGGG